MLFTSAKFFIFLFLLLAAYWFGPKKLPRNLLLLAASWTFYALGELKYFPLLLLITGLNFYAGLWIDRELQAKPRITFRILSLNILVNIGILAIFKFGLAWKYFGFPIGLSFYVFQAMSYSVDVYRRKIAPTKKFTEFALFVSFFPQLIAGPIEKAGHLIDQLKRPYLERKPTELQIKQAAWLIFWGLLKKVAIADRLMPYTRWGTTELNLQHGLDIWMASFAFFIEYLCDFSAYTDMAMGIGLLFGIQLTQNFEYPYFSTGPRQFWKRWHITLGIWFKDYMFRPLLSWGVAQPLALILTMMAVGLWHGGEPKFLLWGFIWGILLILNHLFHRAVTWPKSKALDLVSWFLFMLVLISSSTLFGMKSIGDAGILLGRMLTLSTSPRFLMDLATVSLYVSPFVVIEFLQWFNDDRYFFFKWKFPARVAVVAALLIYLVGNYSQGENEFIYFAF